MGSGLEFTCLELMGDCGASRFLQRGPARTAWARAAVRARGRSSASCAAALAQSARTTRASAVSPQAFTSNLAAGIITAPIAVQP